MTGRHGGALAEDPVIAADIARARAEAARLLAAHSRAGTRPPRLARWLRMPRKKAAAERVSQLLAAPDEDRSDTGTFTGIVRRHESEAEPYSEEAFARPAAAAPREDEAAARVVAERADMARIYVSPAGTGPWGPWDNGQPYPPSPGIAADLTDLPAFREAVSRRTRCRAGECLCGEKVAGQAWGERMALEAHHLIGPDDIPSAFVWPATTQYTASAGTELAPGTPEPPEAATPDGTGDALNPVPAAPEQAGTEDVTA